MSVIDIPSPEEIGVCKNKPYEIGAQWKDIGDEFQKIFTRF